MTTKFDFNNIADLGSFWDGSDNAGGFGGGKFNTYDTGSTIGVNHNLDNLYQNLVGRNADPGGRNYWTKQIQSGATTYQGVADALKASKEYTGQQDAISRGASTAKELKTLPNAYISPFAWGSGSAVSGWKPGDPITQDIANAVTSDPNSPSANYSDQTNFTPTDIWADIISGNLVGGGGAPVKPYDDSKLRGLIGSLSSELGSLHEAFNKYKSDMEKAWANAQSGWGATPQQSSVQGVKTQNELPGWTPKTGGSTGFFGRGNRFGLTTSSLNI
tara:strand:+ start:247 stop:1068 length:822 start_codon:yes stop_codon:yes gene_type:complete